MDTLKTWIKASRLPSLTFIYPSLWLGQAMFVDQYDAFYGSAFIILMLYGLFMATTIVYANDYADFETDQLNDTYTPFTGGSRVLVEKELNKTELFIGAMVMATLSMVVGLYFSIVQSNGFILLFVVIGLLIFQAYSFYPIRLSYRGYGETLQMLGVGLILPLVGFTAQGGDLAQFSWVTALILLPSQLAMALSTSLPDEPSDRKSNKMTTVVNLGNKWSKRLVVGLYLISFVLVMFYLSTATAMVSSVIFAILMISLLIVLTYLMLRYETTPGTNSLLLFVALSILTNTVNVIGAIALIVFG
ncbi:1,4-dihydroxy-2-naphthoate octaprenyltransferase [Pelagirhabdus alkalitolerans]|uniref:1,4-dihydroxy-2-naphthoate octaprenyltransferase n=1 Tax=Pelagirhabdus alkalitolerans TaxID=1612202 RepID=A0A1G6JWK6_9BACI|nr:prenyltransferase [Pelagirhabdus alkalitolerans]SDC23094.1 1,4-dihydroxy-2-naphthoate octaprenyltransferase [Pelagirhabdus alkalitolerans]